MFRLVAWVGPGGSVFPASSEKDGAAVHRPLLECQGLRGHSTVGPLPASLVPRLVSLLECRGCRHWPFSAPLCRTLPVTARLTSTFPPDSCSALRIHPKHHTAYCVAAPWLYIGTARCPCPTVHHTCHCLFKVKLF